MSNSPNTLKHFRTNPIEVAIFLAVTAIFANSVYRLFYDSDEFRAAALTRMAANPRSEGRSPASTQRSFLNVELRCDAMGEQETGAGKIRLTGSLCGTDAATDASKLVKAVVVNAANKFNATVFTDTTAGKFSTDYIPLNAGRNPIQVEFSYRGGKIVTQELVLNKN